MSVRALVAGVGLGVAVGIVLGRIFIMRRVRRLLREWHDGTTRRAILTEAAEHLGSVRGVVLDAGGGQLGIMVNRDTERYPEVGTPVAVVETGPTVLGEPPPP